MKWVRISGNAGFGIPEHPNPILAGRRKYPMVVLARSPEISHVVALSGSSLKILGLVCVCANSSSQNQIS